MNWMWIKYIDIHLDAGCDIYININIYIIHLEDTLLIYPLLTMFFHMHPPKLYHKVLLLVIAKLDQRSSFVMQMTNMVN